MKKSEKFKVKLIGSEDIVCEPEAGSIEITKLKKQKERKT